MIDPGVALGAPPVTTSSGWSADDVILYQLALGAGTPPDDIGEVRYVYERGLAVLPTFASVPASTASALAIRGPGLDLDLRRVLHVEHELVVSRPVPPAAEVTNRAQVVSIDGRGNDARIVVEVETLLTGGALMARNRFHLLALGEGSSALPTPPRRPPSSRGHDRPPDLVVRTPTLPQQAAMFRLCSDRTPVHVDPATAIAVGLPRPSLQGLCTWGVIGKMLVTECLGGDHLAVARYRARFTGMVFPGETLESRVWVEGHTLIAEVTVVEREARSMSVEMEATTAEAPVA